MIEETRDVNNQLDKSETDLLDLLVVVAENLKLLILGPLAVGLLALGICSIVPQSYTSESILALPNAVSAGGVVNPAATTSAQAAAMMTSAHVLDPAIAALNLAAERPIQAARKNLANQVKAFVGKDGLLRLHVTANTPAEAQNIANAVLSSWFKSTVPVDQDRADLEKRLELAKFSLDAVGHLLKRLTTEGASALLQPLTRGEAGTSIVAVSELQAKFLDEVLGISRTLQGYSRNVVKQPPTLPTEPVAPKKGLIGVLVLIGSEIVFLLFVLARHAWRKSAQDAATANKQSKLMKAIGFK